MDVAKIVAFSALTISFAYVALRARRNRRNGFRSLPGPRGFPFFGSLLDINIGEPWLTYTEWSKCYGGIFYSTLLGQNLVVISDEKIAYELLERRSAIYSDRPYLSTNELMGLDFNIAFLPYGSKWKLHRKMYHTTFNKQVTMEYKSMQIEKAYRLLGNLITTPLKYEKHLNMFAGSVIMAVTYGYDVNDEGDPFISRTNRVIEIATQVMTPERAALLTAFPILAYVPSWLPGGRYKQLAAKCRSLLKQVLGDPFRYVKDEMMKGSARKSLVYDLLLQDHNHEHEKTVEEVAMSAFIAGAGSTTSALGVFMLAMILYPEVQAKAQEEIDRVVGHDRLPDFCDRDDLPYVEAILMETLRWYPVVPLGVPHATTKDDVFDGMYIPRGSTVIINVWGMCRDETKFSDPARFKPERHLTADGFVESASSPVFGLGRRFCPGRYVAVQGIWVAMACILATLHITNAKDERGNPVAVVPEFMTGLTLEPKPFLCSIEARSPRAENLIHESGVYE